MFPLILTVLNTGTIKEGVTIIPIKKLPLQGGGGGGGMRRPPKLSIQESDERTSASIRLSLASSRPGNWRPGGFGVTGDENINIK